LIDAPAGVQPGVARGIFCPWLDYLRGPEGVNHLQCRLTTHIFGPGNRDDAMCLQLCAYPKQHARGRCRHMDPTSVILTDGDPPLPRIACRAHHNFDAPDFCARCPDYSPPDEHAPGP
jgi:hypothetical protein